MNQTFEALPREKRRRIVGAALEVFAQHEYKHASTDEIAAKAGISKGLLFYYFRNKKQLYLFIIDLLTKVLTQKVLDERYYEITDFFELLEYVSLKKIRILGKNPLIFSFAVRAYYSVKEDVSGEMSKVTDREMARFSEYFRNIDFSLFKEGKDPMEALNLLIYLADGYMHRQMMMKRPIELEDFLRCFREWAQMVKREFYKEE